MSTMACDLVEEILVQTPRIQLKADGDFNDAKIEKRTRLSNVSDVIIAQRNFHVEMVEVDDDMNAVNPGLQRDIDAIVELVGDRPQTIEIEGRSYVLVIVPHGA